MIRPLLLLVLWLCSVPAKAGYETHARAPELLRMLSDQYGFNAVELDWVKSELAQARQIPKLIEAEQQAKERTLGWNAYRILHVNAANIEKGRAFMRKYSKSLPRAQAEFGVPASVIAAILGVETKYGAYAATTRVIDALTTQGFDHPTRGDFFLTELAAYFALCRDQDWDPQRIRGSYAGAMGAAQFMPSNYRRLALDYNADGRIDLWNLQDAIGSIARYLTEYDPERVWRRGQPIAAPADFGGERDDLTLNARQADSTVAELAAVGLRAAEGLAPDLPAGAIELMSEEGREWWIGLPNFYAIMSYNPRVYYAMSVTQLAQALEDARP